MSVIFEADAHFDGKTAFDGLAKATEDCVDFCGFAEEAAADVFLVHFGGGAAHVEIDPGDGQLLVLDIGNGAPEVIEAFTDELGKDGSPGVVLFYGVDYMGLEGGVGMYAEVLSEEQIGGAILAEQAHERTGGDILHGGEGRPGLAGHSGSGQFVESDC